MLHEVAVFEDLADRRMTLVKVGAQELGLVRWGGDVYAMRAVCPHQLGPMEAGIVRPRLTCSGFLGAVEADTTIPVITCPWHGWEFDLQSGRPACNPRGPGLRTYPVSVARGRVYVDVGRDSGREPTSG
jgi:nitrite reductase/ring-hydroxylating ferredoxin subunit